MRAVVEFLVAAGSILPRVETAFRDGAGIRPAELQAALADPTAIITYGGDLVYCLQEGLADGGAGFGGTFGGPALRRLLAAYGFAVVATYVQPVGYELTRAVPDRAASRPG